MPQTTIELAPAVIDAAQAGDEAAFAEIVRQHHDDMRRVCKVVVGDDLIAEEACESAWAIAWRKLRTLRDPARLRPWLVSVAVNEARQMQRARRRRAVTEITVERSVDRSGGLDPADGITAIDVRNALARLDPEDRALIAMRYLVGFNANELGLATGRSASSTRVRLSRLMARLEKELTGG